MTHFVMACVGEAPIAPVRGSPRLPGGAWNKGRKLQIDVPEPLDYTLKPGASGNLMALYSGVPVPLMSVELIEALRSAGVDNLEVFDAVIRGDGGVEHRDHRAFNVIGLVAAADAGASELMGTTNSTLIDVDYDSLTIDEERAAQHKLFRLAENVSAIVVDDSVREVVESRGIPGMVFYGPGEWTG